MTTPNPSKQELAIQQIVTTLQATYGVGGRVWRDRAETLARSELPALVIYPENAPPTS